MKNINDLTISEMAQIKLTAERMYYKKEFPKREALLNSIMKIIRDCEGDIFYITSINEQSIDISVVYITMQTVKQLINFCEENNRLKKSIGLNFAFDNMDRVRLHFYFKSLI